MATVPSQWSAPRVIRISGVEDSEIGSFSKSIEKTNPVTSANGFGPGPAS